MASCRSSLPPEKSREKERFDRKWEERERWRKSIVRSKDGVARWLRRSLAMSGRADEGRGGYKLQEEALCKGDRQFGGKRG